MIATRTSPEVRLDGWVSFAGEGFFRALFRNFVATWRAFFFYFGGQVADAFAKLAAETVAHDSNSLKTRDDVNKLEKVGLGIVHLGTFDNPDHPMKGAIAKRSGAGPETAWPFGAEFGKRGHMPNAYETGARKIVPATLIYVTHGPEVLMLHRRQGKDAGGRKWNGLGGKLEPDESPRQGARRELLEESGLHLPEEAFRCFGFLQFPNFKAHRSEDWNCTVFLAECSSKDRDRIAAAPASPEGDLSWVRRTDVLQLALWPGDRYFLPWILADHPRPFTATLWYSPDGQVTRVEGPHALA